MTLHCVKRMVARAAGSLLDLDDRLLAGRGRYVISYHRIISAEQAAGEWVHNSMWISPETFEAQIRWMLEIGEIAPYSRIMDFGVPNELPLFAITFDDGWRDNYENALPIINRYDIDAIVFLATSAMEDGSLIWPEDLTIKTRCSTQSHPEHEVRRSLQTLTYNLPGHYPKGALQEQVEWTIEALKTIDDAERTERIAAYYESLGLPRAPLSGYMMTWNEARVMLKAGVSFGSHTHTHRICSQSSPEEIETELVLSREAIRSNLRTEVDAFAYPNARYHGIEGPILARNGFRYAFRIHNRPVNPLTDPFFIPRFISNERTANVSQYFKLRLLNAPYFS
jgi:peptidoglycan/xylan/chitin deacetylase (PgdA/CDA1 family)